MFRALEVINKNCKLNRSFNSGFFKLHLYTLTNPVSLYELAKFNYLNSAQIVGFFYPMPCFRRKFSYHVDIDYTLLSSIAPQADF